FRQPEPDSSPGKRLALGGDRSWLVWHTDRGWPSLLVGKTMSPFFARQRAAYSSWCDDLWNRFHHSRVLRRFRSPFGLALAGTVSRQHRDPSRRCVSPIENSRSHISNSWSGFTRDRMLVVKRE